MGKSTVNTQFSLGAFSPQWTTVLLLLLVLMGSGSSGCTEPNAHFGEGNEGAACRPDGTCQASLRCVQNRCVHDEPMQDDMMILPDGSRTGDLTLSRDQGLPHDGTCATKPTAPVLKSFPVSTTSTTIPLQGTAKKAKRVVVTGGATTQIQDVVSDAFCVEVELKPAAANNLQVVAVDEQGCYSQPTTAIIQQINQSGANLLLGKMATASDVKNGTLNLLTDGYTKDWLRISFYDPTPVCDYFAYVAFDLGSTQIVDKVVVKYPAGPAFDHYVTCWDLLGSFKKDPVEPYPTDPDWFVIKQANTTPSGELSISLGKMQVRHLALILYQDGVSSLSETFDIAEIEAYSGATSPPPLHCP
jgi:hypothetical protein